jgi:DNA polymerase III alpha subunit
VLFIVREFAGYSLGQADIFRKAMGKKIPEVMLKEKANFINGAKKLGYSEEIAGTIFALIEPFAGYAFNKAHSVSYALIAYQTALPQVTTLRIYDCLLNGEFRRWRKWVLQSMNAGGWELPFYRRM